MSLDKKLYVVSDNGDEKDKKRLLDDQVDASTEYRGKVSEVKIICFVYLISTELSICFKV